MTIKGYAECNYATSRIFTVMLSVVMLNVAILSVVPSRWYPVAFRPKIVKIRLA
jgi:hypothetical protein